MAGQDSGPALGLEENGLGCREEHGSRTDICMGRENTSNKHNNKIPLLTEVSLREVTHLRCLGRCVQHLCWFFCFGVYFLASWPSCQIHKPSLHREKPTSQMATSSISSLRLTPVLWKERCGAWLFGTTVKAACR